MYICTAVNDDTPSIASTALAAIPRRMSMAWSFLPPRGSTSARHGGYTRGSGKVGPRGWGHEGGLRWGRAGGLYFAVLSKLRNASGEVSVLVRNPEALTFGWGVSARRGDQVVRLDRRQPRASAATVSRWDGTGRWGCWPTGRARWARRFVTNSR